MRRFLSVPTLIFTNRRWQKIRNHYLFKNYKNSNNYAFIYTGYKNREVCIDDLKDKNIVSFENIDFYTFRNPISFLETWYGKNWNIPPKVAEQECHPIFEIDFGNY